MKKFTNIIIICFLLFISRQLKAAEKVPVEIYKAGCLDIKQGKIKYTDGKKEILINESYCFDNKSKSISSVRKCEKPDDSKDCLVSLPGPYEVSISEVESEAGSPGFKICSKFKGTPQFIEYWDGANWIETARCIFEDTSYVDIQELSLKVKYVK